MHVTKSVCYAAYASRGSNVVECVPVLLFSPGCKYIKLRGDRELGPYGACELGRRATVESGGSSAVRSNPDGVESCGPATVTCVLGGEKVLRRKVLTWPPQDVPVHTKTTILIQYVRIPDGLGPDPGLRSESRNNVRIIFRTHLHTHKLAS